MVLWTNPLWPTKQGPSRWYVEPVDNVIHLVAAHAISFIHPEIKREVAQAAPENQTRYTLDELFQQIKDK